MIQTYQISSIRQEHLSQTSNIAKPHHLPHFAKNPHPKNSSNHPFYLPFTTEFLYPICTIDKINLKDYHCLTLKQHASL